MSVKTNIQVTIEKRRALYVREGSPTLLQQCCQFHRLSYRDFAKVFDISLGHAENVIKHRTMPSLELGIEIARYFECTVEDLFGWRVDDSGKRCPLIVEDPKTGMAYKVTTKNTKEKRTLDLVTENLEESC